MRLQPINNNSQTFNALTITDAAKALIEREKGGAYKLLKYTDELKNSRWDLNVGLLQRSGLNSDNIHVRFGDEREDGVIPCRLNNEYVMVRSHAVGHDIDEDIFDCLKFSSAKRAKQVYDQLNELFLANPKDGGQWKTPLQELEWAVCAMKAFTEAEIVPKKTSSMEHFVTPYVQIVISSDSQSQHLESVDNKPSLSQRLMKAWNSLFKK